MRKKRKRASTAEQFVPGAVATGSRVVFPPVSHIDARPRGLTRTAFGSCRSAVCRRSTSCCSACANLSAIGRADWHRRGRVRGARPRHQANAVSACSAHHAAQGGGRKLIGPRRRRARQSERRAGNRERREHNHQQSKRVIEGNCRGWRSARLCRLTTLWLSLRQRSVAVRAPGRTIWDSGGGSMTPRALHA